MEPGGVAPNATAAGDSGTQDVRKVLLPSVTSTISGLPISPAYAGGINPLKFNFSTKSRSSAFKREHQAYRYSDTAMRNEYVPQHRGSRSQVVQQKTMEGTGEVFVDPLDDFKPQAFKEARRSADIGNGADEHKRRESAGKFRNTGKLAYRAENKGNTEGWSRRRQIRYTQG